MNSYNQFILWKSVPRPDGRTDKLPIDYRTGKPGDAHDPGAWLDRPTATALAGALGLGVGFVFTAADPFFFIDIDHAREGDTWSPLAVSLLERLDGCAVEVSQSGEGLHIFGRAEPMSHKCKNIPLGLELYTEKRFVALTGREARGDAGLDATGPLTAVVNEYFEPDVLAVPGPPVVSDAPADDLELITKARAASPSAGETFGGDPTFAQLFERDVEVLGRWRPSETGQEFDASSADIRLANKLTFWCGDDAARIERIMRLSKLRRDKWDDRPGYLPGTIAKALERPHGVYSAGYRSQVPDRPTRPRTGPSVLGPDAQVDHFDGCVYVSDVHRVSMPNGELLKPESFRVARGGRCFLMDYPRDEGKTPTTKDAFKAFTESEAVECETVASLRFRPDKPPVEVFTEDKKRFLNSYQPIGGERKAGDAGPFLRHVEKMIPDENDREVLLSYLAATVQQPEVKANWAPVVVGAPGNGKTGVLRKPIEYALGFDHCHEVGPNDLDNKFNGWIEGKLLVVIEEIKIGGKTKTAETLKAVVSNERVDAQSKGADQRTINNYANFLMFSNHRDAIHKDADDRRYAVLYTAQEHKEDLARDGMGGSYFRDLFDWLRNGGNAIVADYLATHPIKFGVQGPAPTTTGTTEAIEQSLGGAEQIILEAVESEEPGFRGGLIWSGSADRLLKEGGKRLHSRKLGEAMGNIGYVKHPALGPTGRVMIGGLKKTVYVKAGTIAAVEYETPGDVRAALERALGIGGLDDEYEQRSAQ